MNAGPILTALAALLLAPATLVAQDVRNDPHVRMPGTQPSPEGDVTLEAPDRCLNCHAGYNPAVEPGHNWKGSMMAQASRDFLFFSCMTVAGQDSQWALGTPNAMDLCLRCHFPQGWLEGRSDPVNASAMIGSDWDGVQCDFCHAMYDPFYETTYNGSREGSDWLRTFDETDLSGTPSSQFAWDAWLADSAEAAKVFRYANGAKNQLFFANELPPPGYTEAGSGQYYVDASRNKRASFADASARHGMVYSRFHKSKYFCATCHDVSNPALANLGADPSLDLPTELNSAHSYFHVERTFSEFMLSDYGLPDGAPGMGPFDPTVFETSHPDNNVSRCQDCHMRDGVGAGCNKKGALIRPGQSVEHPESGMPIHDLTGGNVWVSSVLASAVPGSPNYDATNDALLNQGPAALTLDMNAGLGIDAPAMLAGASRAAQQLQMAADIQNLSYNASNGALSFRVQNQTGHKLISGFPEGRRMFVNVRLYSAGSLVYEVNPYDAAGGTLKGLHYNYQPDPDGVLPLPQAIDPATELYRDDLVYETHPSSQDLTGEDETFHFVLATNRFKDNRIPPKGFRINEALERLCQPRTGGQDDEALYTAAEYAGGYDDVSLTVLPGADGIEVNLYYQTTSREYIEFLRDEIEGNPANMTLPVSAYIAQSDPFYGALKAWGMTIWRLWTNNMDWDGAAPFLMTSTSQGQVPGPCDAPAPTLLSAVPGNAEVTLTWSDEHTVDPNVVGYSVYYDQAGKAQWIADLGLVTTYTDTGLTNNLQYSYKVTTRTEVCESDFSNVLSAIPSAGQNDAGVNQLDTGKWVVTGKGKDRVEAFVLTGVFNQGDEIVFQAYVVDGGTGLPLANATVDLDITGPEALSLVSAPSDGNGVAEARWMTQAPNRKGQGGTAVGGYTVTVTNLIAAGYQWDGVATSASFTIE